MQSMYPACQPLMTTLQLNWLTPYSSVMTNYSAVNEATETTKNAIKPGD